MRRREVIAALGSAMACWAGLGPVAAQPFARGTRVGFLHPRLSAVVEALRLVAIREGLGISGQNSDPLELVSRVSDGNLDRLAAYARELAALRVDVIIAISPSGVRAAREATATIPIVAVDLETDPVASGLAKSLGQPGGNVTGVFLDLAEICAKCLQLLDEVIPRLTQVAILWDPSTGPYQLAAVEKAAAANGTTLLGTTLLIHRADTIDQVDVAFRSIRDEQSQAVLMLSSPLFAGNSARVAEFAARDRLPAITLFPEFARNGGLLAYGPDLQALFRQGGAIARRILQGTEPQNLPIERPSRFEMVVNAKTGRHLGLAFPTSLLAFADEVIE
jgi:putative tryptophan/tyrosine transport system substrate-binding protein